ncbi:hypothetical protein ACFE04_019729 [Oxalis oulophora]
MEKDLRNFFPVPAALGPLTPVDESNRTVRSGPGDRLRESISVYTWLGPMSGALCFVLILIRLHLNFYWLLPLLHSFIPKEPYLTQKRNPLILIVALGFRFALLSFTPIKIVGLYKRGSNHSDGCFFQKAHEIFDSGTLLDGTLIEAFFRMKGRRLNWCHLKGQKTKRLRRLSQARVLAKWNEASFFPYFAILPVSHAPFQSLACFGAWPKERSPSLPSNKQSSHKDWSVIGSVLVLDLLSLALASEAVVAEVELGMEVKSEPRMSGEYRDTGKGIMVVRPKIGMRGRNGKINGWGIPIWWSNLNGDLNLEQLESFCINSSASAGSGTGSCL